jgi:hypothetical protein
LNFPRKEEALALVHFRGGSEEREGVIGLLRHGGEGPHVFGRTSTSKAEARTKEMRIDAPVGAKSADTSSMSARHASAKLATPLIKAIFIAGMRWQRA